MASEFLESENSRQYLGPVEGLDFGHPATEFTKGCLQELDSFIWVAEEKERELLVEKGARLMQLLEEEKMTKTMWK